jgi:hypothetical protein
MLRAVAALSGIYDLLIGLSLLAAAPLVAAAFGLPPPVPPVLAQTNGLLLIAVGLGYALPWRDPVRWRAYLWLMGPLLKGGGAVVFVLDWLLRDSPASFLIFAAGDGSLAVLTLVALVRARREQAEARLGWSEQHRPKP